MMKNYVIHLERASERREYLSKEFTRHGINYEIAKAVDWRDIGDEDIQKHVHPRYLENARKFKRPLVHGGLACWLSHRKVWELALESNADIVSVFEDDSRLTSELKPALESIERLNKSQDFKFDIIFLYNGKTRNPIIPVYRIDDTFTLGVIKYDSIGAVGYVITNRAMKSLLKQYPRMVEVVDIVMHSWWMNGLSTYVITPQVVFHGEDNLTHHSYGKESYTNEYIQSLGLGFLRHNKSKTLRQKLHILFSQGIPKRIAFRKRMLNENFHLE